MTGSVSFAGVLFRAYDIIFNVLSQIVASASFYWSLCVEEDIVSNAEKPM